MVLYYLFLCTRNTQSVGFFGSTTIHQSINHKYECQKIVGGKKKKKAVIFIDNFFFSSDDKFKKFVILIADNTGGKRQIHLATLSEKMDYLKWKRFQNISGQKEPCKQSRLVIINIFFSSSARFHVFNRKSCIMGILHWVVPPQIAFLIYDIKPTSQSTEI